MLDTSPFFSLINQSSKMCKPSSRLPPKNNVFLFKGLPDCKYKRFVPPPPQPHPVFWIFQIPQFHPFPLEDKKFFP